MKLVRCRDHGFDCDFQARAESAEEVLKQAAEHAQHVHHLDVTPELAKKVRQSIREIAEQ